MEPVHHHDDLDRWAAALDAVTSHDDFVACLCRLYDESPASSLDAVAQASSVAGHAISRSTVRNLVSGRSRPSRRSLVGFLYGCGLPAESHQPWIDRYNQLCPPAGGRRLAEHADRPQSAVQDGVGAALAARAPDGTEPERPADAEAAESDPPGYLRTLFNQAAAPFSLGGFVALLAQLLDVKGWPVVVSVVAAGLGAIMAHWRWRASRWQSVIGMTVTALGTAGIVAISQTPSPSSPPGAPPAAPVLNGDYNLAIAQFTTTLGNDVPLAVTTEVNNFVPSVVAGIRTALAQSAPPDPDVQLLRIDVRDLPSTVAGSRLEEQLSAARALGERSNADAVLFGDIANDGAALVVTPRLWLSPRTLPRAEELSGVHSFQIAREDISRPDAAIRLRRLVADQAEDLATLTDLIRHYDSGRYETALNLLRKARSRGFFQEGLLYILEGNLAGKLRQSDEAVTAYRRADAYPAYQLRAKLGLLQVQYSAALGREARCGSDVRTAELERVVQGYAKLQEGTDSNGANIGPKALFGEARARMCLDASGSRRDAGRGRQLLLEVIGQYEAGERTAPDSDLRELAAEAEALLGDHEARRAKGGTDLLAAISHLDRAGQLTTFTDRRLGFTMAQAELLYQAGESDQACEKVRQAGKLVPSGSALPAVQGLECR